MILSRAKPAIKDDKAEKEKSGSAKKQVPTIEQFLEKRDYTGPCPSVNIVQTFKPAKIYFGRLI